jgi:signal transduction histidine kinase
MNVVPIVQAADLIEFEAYAQEFVDMGYEGVPAGFGQHPFGDNVVYSVNFTDPTILNGVKYRDYGVNFKGKHKILTPAFNTIVSFIFMLNTYSYRQNYISIDQLIENSQNGIRDVAVTSDFIQLLTNEMATPSTIFYYPIFPRENKTDLVGFVQLSHDWEKTVENSVRAAAHADLWVQIHRVRPVGGVTSGDNEAGASSYTFEVADGDVCDVKLGTWGPRSKDVQGYKIYYPASEDGEDCAGCDLFEFTYYPTDHGYEKHLSSTAVIFGIVAFVSCALVALFFFTYYQALSSEALRQLALLESKRHFVRFISHEIRTPLNTTGIGLKILCTELQEVLEELVDTNGPFGGYLSSWLELVEEVSESSATAVVVLDDLINYDKIESNTLRIDKKLIHAESFLLKSLKSFHPHRKNTGINYVVKHGVSPPLKPLPGPAACETMGHADNGTDANSIVVDLSSTENSSPTTTTTPPTTTPTTTTNGSGNGNGSVRCAKDVDCDSRGIVSCEESPGYGYLGKSPTHSISMSIHENSDAYESTALKLKKEHCLLGDSFKISQVIRNIVSNAIKFTSDGHNVTVTVQWQPNGLPNFHTAQFLEYGSGIIPENAVLPLHFNEQVFDVPLRCVRPAGSVLIECTDEGPGLSPDQVEKLFGQGVQFNANELQSGGGSGLGLWISKVGL